jgi:hypothetical protein
LVILFGYLGGVSEPIPLDSPYIKQIHVGETLTRCLDCRIWVFGARDLEEKRLRSLIFGGSVTQIL